MLGLNLQKNKKQLEKLIIYDLNSSDSRNSRECRILLLIAAELAQAAAAATGTAAPVQFAQAAAAFAAAAHNSSGPNNWLVYLLSLPGTREKAPGNVFLPF